MKAAAGPAGGDPGSPGSPFWFGCLVGAGGWLGWVTSSSWAVRERGAVTASNLFKCVREGGDAGSGLTLAREGWRAGTAWSSSSAATTWLLSPACMVRAWAPSPLAFAAPPRSNDRSDDRRAPNPMAISHPTTAISFAALLDTSRYFREYVLHVDEVPPRGGGGRPGRRVERPGLRPGASRSFSASSWDASSAPLIA